MYGAERSSHKRLLNNAETQMNIKKVFAIPKQLQLKLILSAEAPTTIIVRQSPPLPVPKFKNFDRQRSIATAGSGFKKKFIT